MDTKILFTLPSLIHKRILEDNSRDYALSAYSSDVVMKCVLLLMENITNVSQHLLIDSQRRIDFFIEVLGAALTLPANYIHFLRYVKKTYHKFFVDTSIFGENMELVNTYLSKIIRQLSQPFALRERSNYNNDYMEFLSSILDEFIFILTKKNKVLNKSSWTTTINVLIGVTDSLIFQRNIKDETFDKIIGKCFECCFGAHYICPYAFDETWNDFYRFTDQWSQKEQFTDFWGKTVHELFSILLEKTYDIPICEQKQTAISFFKFDSFQKDILIIYFYHTLKAISYKQTISSPDNYTKFVTVLFHLTDALIKISKKTSNSSLFYGKHDALSFFDIFGRYLVHLPVVSSTDYDNALALNMNTIFSIIKSLNTEETEEVLIQLIVSLLQYVNEEHPLVYVTFLNFSHYLFSSKFKIVPYIAELTVKYSIGIKSPKFEKYISNFFIDSLVTGLGSSCAVLSRRVDFQPIINSAIKTLWNSTINVKTLFRILCFSSQYEKNMNSFLMRLVEFNDLSYIKIISLFISSYLRLNPKFIDQIIENDLLVKIINKIMKMENYDIEEFRKTCIFLLQAIYYLLIWRNDIFKNESIFYGYFNFITFVALKISSLENCFYIQQLIHLTLIKIYFNTFLQDILSSKFDEISLIDEQLIINKMNIKEPLISYFTINDCILISFIEDKSEIGKIIFLIRSEFGKCVLSGNIKEFRNYQKHNEEIPIIKSNKPEKKFIFKKTYSNILNNNIDESDFNKADNLLVFNTNSNELKSEVENDVSDEGGENNSLKLFLMTFGLLDSKNGRNIKIHQKSINLLCTIKLIDEIYQCSIIPIPLLHVFPNDKEITNHYKVTKSFQEFLYSFDKNYVIPQKISEKINLPKFRTPIPVIPAFDSFLAILSPEMAEDENDETIFKMKNNSKIVIIFNESIFDLKQQENMKDQILIIVTPAINSLFNVEVISNVDTSIYLPIQEPQLMSIKEFKFLISIIYDQVSSFKNDKKSKFHEQISSICKEQKENLDYSLIQKLNR